LTRRIRNARRTQAFKARVRKLEVKDLDQVLSLAERYASWDAAATRADIERFHSTDPEFFFVAETEEKIVGFVYGTESKPPAETLDKWKSRKVASVETLAVDEEHRKRGIATSLLRELFDAFRRNEIDTVTLSVPAVEIGALKLYRKLGFEPRGYFLWKRLGK
jgi:ribosomal protein S18 acetylase RimI-like enzyme